VRTEPDQNWQVAGVGDFNGDGKATSCGETAPLAKDYVYLMNGTTSTGGSLRTQADLNCRWPAWAISRRWQSRHLWRTAPLAKTMSG